MDFSRQILQWYAEHRRELPWRNTREPYRIWLSEIILQQTRVAQGTPYYRRFVERFPTVADLATAREEEVLKLWQGLGYYSRARNLHKTAKKVAFELNGHFPTSYDELLALKGIGDYTASAIASICFNEPRPVVDGNVYRVLSRYFGAEIPINTGKGPAYFKKLAHEVMEPRRIGEYNQGIMEFGALQCTPQRPDCPRCPLNQGCAALQRDLVTQLPVKLKKTRVRKRYFNYAVPHAPNRDGTYTSILHQRTGKDIWRHLWEFPLVESESEIGAEELRERAATVLPLPATADIRLYNERPIVHKLSHQELHARFWIVSLKDALPNGIPLNALKEYAVPVLVADFIKTLENSYF